LFGDLVDDALDEDNADVDVAGNVGEELGDEVVNGSGGESDGVAGGGGGEVGLPAGDVEVADFVVDGEGGEVGVVGHLLAVVALGVDHLNDGVGDATLEGGVGEAVVVRVLVDEGRDEEGTEELTGEVLGVADADVAAEAVHSGAVGGVGVRADGDGGGAEDGDCVEGVKEVACGEAGLLSGGEGLDLRAGEEAGEPVDDGNGGAERGRRPQARLRAGLGGRLRGR